MRSTSVPIPSIGNKAKGKQPVKDDPPSGTMPPKKSHIRRDELALSTSRTPMRETSRKDTTEVAKIPLDDFVVPPAGTPYGEGSFNPLGIVDLSPMLDEIWSEESF